MNQLHCNISGIQNNVGKTQIKNALNKIKGVQEIGVNLATGELTVKYNELVTETEIRDCIENTGFKII